jgi:hypothetical protein
MEDRMQVWRGDLDERGTAWPEWLWDRGRTILSRGDAYRLRQERLRIGRAQFEVGRVSDVSEPLLPRRLLLYQPQSSARDTGADRN